MIQRRLLSGIHRHIQTTRSKLRGTEVFALVGKAGTGKSFRARLVADSHGVETIIDDGLLIHRGKIIAGRSAKQEQHYLAAIKTALFHDLAHRKEILDTFSSMRMDKILLIGTSERMIRRNCLTLNLPMPSKWVRIEDLATQEEIAAAIHDRKTYGKHVIPLPILEVRQAYPKLVARAIKVLFNRGLAKANTEHAYDKSVVRPSYHSKGKITISDTALTQMILHCVREKSPQIEIRRIRLKDESGGFFVQLDLAFPFGIEAAETCHELQDYTIRQIENFTGIRLARLQLNVTDVPSGAHHKKPT